MRKLLALLLLVIAAPAAARDLIVCADPNNLPFSNKAQEGFENRIVDLVARELDAKVSYVWWAQRRGYVRNTLNEAKCDLWPGVASAVDMVATTRPYYRSTYMFVSRASDALQGLTLDDERLRALKIGVQLVGDDGSNTPPSHALARRGIVQNLRGYMLYGDYSRPNPPAEIVDAVEKGEIDLGLVWGPLAGYFAAKSPVPLRLEPVTPWLDAGQWPMVYDISMGIRRDEPQLRREIEQILAAKKQEVRAILTEYHIPLVAD